jgi:hypothetical protein
LSKVKFKILFSPILNKYFSNKFTKFKSSLSLKIASNSLNSRLRVNYIFYYQYVASLHASYKRIQFLLSTYEIWKVLISLAKNLELHCHGQLRVAYSLSQIPNSPNSKYSLSIGNFMLIMKNPRILNLSPCTQKMCSLPPWYTEFPVYFNSLFIQMEPNHSILHLFESYRFWSPAGEFMKSNLVLDLLWNWNFEIYGLFYGPLGRTRKYPEK